MKKVTTKIIHIPYLEFTGNETSYINIAPIEFTTDNIINLRCNNLKKNVYDFSTDLWQCPYGIWSNDNKNTLFIIKKSSESQIVLDWYPGNFSINYPVVYIIPKHNLTEDYDDIRITNNGIYFSNYSFDKNLRYKENFINTTYDDFYLGSSGKYPMIGKINYFRIERKNSLYKHYLPCVRFYNLVDDDNIIIQENLLDYGFFESVNQDYYIADPATIPAHTGDELLSDYTNMLDINGNIINYSGEGDIIDNTYLKIDYIQTNNNAYIDTGIQSDNIIIKTKFNIQKKNDKLFQFVFGYQKASANFNIFTLEYQQNNKNYLTMVVNNGDKYDFLRNDNSIVELNKDYEAECILNAENKYAKYTLNGETIGENNNVVYNEWISNLGIFNSLPNNKFNSYMKMYYFNIYDINNNPIRQYIPTIRLTDLKVGMYDLVEKKFYLSPNGSEFTR